MTPHPNQKFDWTKIESVFELLETDGRVLSEGERRVIAGQRKIKRPHAALMCRRRGEQARRAK